MPVGVATCQPIGGPKVITQMKRKPRQSQAPIEPVAGNVESEAAGLFAGASCFAEVFARVKKLNFKGARWSEVVAKYPAMRQAEHELLRYFEPWPDWVLRIAAELLRVQFPTGTRVDLGDRAADPGAERICRAAAALGGRAHPGLAGEAAAPGLALRANAPTTAKASPIWP